MIANPVSNAEGARVEVRQVGRVFAGPQSSTVALEPISLCVEPGEFVVVVGPSGCGKTTLLRMMAGLEQPTVGEITVSTASGRSARGAMVFQDKAVFPWLSVLDNVAYGLRVQGVRRRAARARAQDLVDIVGLADFAQALPHQLSGGMKQRVSIARALVTDPDVLYMDEPLAALDEQTKTVVQAELLRVWENTGKSVVYVTHSIDEALVLGDRVVVLTARPGRVKSEIRVDLPRPRDVIALRSSLRYTELSRQVWDALRDELHLEEA